MIRGLALTAAMAAALALDAINLPVAAAEPASRPIARAEPSDPVAVPTNTEADRRQADELDMLARARAELPRGDTISATPGSTAPGSTAPGTNQSDASNGDADLPDDPAEAIRAQAIEAEVQRRLLEAEREAELDEVSARIRRSAAARAPAADMPTADIPEATAGSATAGVGVGTGAAEQQGEPPGRADAALPSDGRATLLLVMRPGRSGIRALNPTADPIVCSNDVCWVSRGADRDARMVSRRKALGALNTLGERAGACNGSTGCVFRNIELGGSSAVVQPVDLRVIRHDRRAPVEVRIDRTCTIVDGRLACRMQAAAGDYRIWAVPEPTAQAAGARALMSAVGTRLTTVARDEN